MQQPEGKGSAKATHGTQRDPAASSQQVCSFKAHKTPRTLLLPAAHAAASVSGWGWKWAALGQFKHFPFSCATSCPRRGFSTKLPLSQPRGAAPRGTGPPVRVSLGPQRLKKPEEVAQAPFGVEITPKCSSCSKKLAESSHRVAAGVATGLVHDRSPVLILQGKMKT